MENFENMSVDELVNDMIDELCETFGVDVEDREELVKNIKTLNAKMEASK